LTILTLPPANVKLQQRAFNLQRDHSPPVQDALSILNG